MMSKVNLPSTILLNNCTTDDSLCVLATGCNLDISKNPIDLSITRDAFSNNYNSLQKGMLKKNTRSFTFTGFLNRNKNNAMLMSDADYRTTLEHVTVKLMDMLGNCTKEVSHKR